MADTLHEQDFYRWTQEQARALRALAGQGANAPVDWENVAEAIESLGRSDRREITNRLATIVEHLLKLEHLPAREPRAGWADTVQRERVRVEALIAESPSLRPELPAMAAAAWTLGFRVARVSLSSYGETEAALHVEQASAPYTADQMLAETWFPPDPVDRGGGSVPQ
jgi:hypothetical protein